MKFVSLINKCKHKN